jgi:uncharacterized OsmC-like protein
MTGGPPEEVGRENYFRRNRVPGIMEPGIYFRNKEGRMGEIVHVSKIKVTKEPGKGKVKQAHIEGFPQPLRMGVNGGIKKFYGIETDEELPATLDYVVAAVGSCLTGTLAGALEGRSISTDLGKLSADVEGTIEGIEGKPLITRVHVKYKLKVPKGKRAEAQRAVDHHDKLCAVSQSIRRGFTIDWESEIEEE